MDSPQRKQYNLEAGASVKQEDENEDTASYPFEYINVDEDLFEEIKTIGESADGEIKPEVDTLMEEVEIKPEITEEKDTFACTRCFFETSSKTLLDTHMAEAHPPKMTPIQWFACNHCDYKSSKATHVNNHVLNHHANKFFKCTHANCSFKTMFVDSLNTHLKSTHSELLSWFKCTKCSYQTIYKSLFSNHKATAHLPGKNSAEAQKRVLKRIVLPKYFYMCEHCKCKFRTQKELHKHIFSTHADSEGEYYHCSKCIFKTTVKSWYHLHMKNIHFMSIEEVIVFIPPSTVDFTQFDKFLNIYERNVLYDYNVQNRWTGRLLCAICSDVLRGTSTFKKHIHQEHSTSEVVKLMKKSAMEKTDKCEMKVIPITGISIANAKQDQNS